MSSGAIPQLSNTDRRDVSPKDLNSLQQIHGAVEVRITPGENGGLSGILISVVKAEHVALSINQASFKRVHYVAGDPITAGGGGGSNSRHSHRMFLALMHCVNPLTIQFQTRTPAVCSVPSASFQVSLTLLPLGPHTSIIHSKEWRESPVPSHGRNLPQRCSGGSETVDRV